jgi:class II flagellar assembly regulator FliX
MRILGPNGPATSAATPAARRAATGVFSLPSEEAHSAPAGTTGVRTVGGIDALIALQGVEGVDERRRRAAKRGHAALDVLDEMKLGLLSGRLEPGMLLRLKSAAAGLKDLSGDPQLDGVLAEIDLRVEVELAKVETAVAA